MSNIDFSNLPSDHEATVKIEKSESAADASARRAKDLALFFFALIVVAVLIGICVYIAQSATSSVDDKKWATSVITAVIGGLVGFLVKK